MLWATIEMVVMVEDCVEKKEWSEVVKEWWSWDWGQGSIMAYHKPRRTGARITLKKQHQDVNHIAYISWMRRQTEKRMQVHQFSKLSEIVSCCLFCLNPRQSLFGLRQVNRNIDDNTSLRKLITHWSLCPALVAECAPSFVSQRCRDGRLHLFHQSMS